MTATCAARLRSSCPSSRSSFRARRRVPGQDRTGRGGGGVTDADRGSAARRVRRGVRRDDWRPDHAKRASGRANDANMLHADWVIGRSRKIARRAGAAPRRGRCTGAGRGMLRTWQQRSRVERRRAWCCAHGSCVVVCTRWAKFCAGGLWRGTVVVGNACVATFMVAKRLLLVVVVGLCVWCIGSDCGQVEAFSR